MIVGPDFDDGVYAGTRMIEILTRFADANEPLKNLLANAVSSHQNYRFRQLKGKFQVVEKLSKMLSLRMPKISLPSTASELSGMMDLP